LLILWVSSLDKPTLLVAEFDVREITVSQANNVPSFKAATTPCQHGQPTNSGEERVMEATILRIMESWPLQLALQTPAGIEHVMLTESATIRHSGILTDPGALRPGLSIRVLMRTPRGEIAELEILD
jgi:hypothetical protein